MKPLPVFLDMDSSADYYPEYLFRSYLPQRPAVVQRVHHVDHGKLRPHDFHAFMRKWGGILSHSDDGDRYRCLVRAPEGDLHLLVYTDGRVFVHTAARSLRYDFVDAARDAFPEPQIEEDNAIWVNFWFNTVQGPRTTRRRLRVPSLDTQNYAAKVAQSLLKMQDLERPEGQGQLMLWHGEPGTGKTYAVRALAWAWREWARLEYVTDPEAFLGDSQYMMQVLLGDGAPQTQAEIHHPKWKLIVLEDAGELIGMDSKAKTGQAFSRLLNLTEGLIGQGLEVLVLITTNEDVGRINPAVKRPGRCLADVPFSALSAAEAAGWCEEHGLEPLGGRQVATLAELFAYHNSGRVWGREEVGLPHG